MICRLHGQQPIPVYVDQTGRVANAEAYVAQRYIVVNAQFLNFVFQRYGDEAV